MDTHTIYLDQDTDNNNITFQYDDITIIIYRAQSLVVTMRLFWNGFDAEWSKNEFARTVKRLNNKLK